MLELKLKDKVEIEDINDAVSYFINNKSGVLVRKCPEKKDMILSIYFYKEDLGLCRVSKSVMMQCESLDRLLERANEGFRVSDQGMHLLSYDFDFYEVEIVEDYSIKDIPWEFINEEYQYAAMNLSGALLLYKKEPKAIVSSGFWYEEGGDSLTSFTNIFKTDIIKKPNKEFWHKSLTCRPNA